MKLIERNQCSITGNSDLEPLYDFPNFPIYMGCIDQSSELDIRQDMSWWISKGSGLIQLKQLLPLDVLYHESHGAGSVGALWKEHHNKFAAFLNKREPKSVLEIGGAHGILAKEYQQFFQIPWTILEPNPSPVVGCKAHFIKGFFDENFRCDADFDAVVHSHVLEHIYKPEEFMKHLSVFIGEGKSLLFSLPNMQVMLDKKYTNCLDFEHTIFITEPYVEYLLAKYGFRMIEKQYFLDDHSIFYAAVRDTSVKARPLPSGLYDANKKVFMSYVRYHKSLVADLNKKINEAVEPVYLFGAHVFSQFLLEMGLNPKVIVCLLDNDKNKHGRRLYGTNLNVASPAVLTEVKDPIVILKAGVYNDEIKQDILGNINDSAIFLE
jgi:hypothetical protein